MVELSIRQEFAVLTLSRPEALNALNRQTLDELGRAFDAVERSDARCVILMGAGDKAFCAGADISEIAGETSTVSYDRTIRGQRLFSRLETLRQPSIALVHGYALGGGCELALAATFRLATRSAKFGLTEVKLGLVPGYGGTQRLPRLVGSSTALDMMLSGRLVDAEEALRCGLIDRILQNDEPLLEQAMSFGRSFTGWSLVAQQLIRQAVFGAVGLSTAEGLALEAGLSTLSLSTKDAKEGIAAFMEKRSPRFSDL